MGGGVGESVFSGFFKGFLKGCLKASKDFFSVFGGVFQCVGREKKWSSIVSGFLEVARLAEEG